jgi:hypothetical protein
MNFFSLFLADRTRALGCTDTGNTGVDVHSTSVDVISMVGLDDFIEVDDELVDVVLGESENFCPI